MKIVVCIKQVPDTNEVKLDPITNTLIRDGVPSIINPDDKSAIESALVIREKVGGTVSVVCMGPPQAEEALREALSMGCDEAILVTSREFGGSDTLATSTIVSAVLKKIGFDIVLTGRQAIDGDTAQVGPQIAEHLGIPQVSYVEEVEPDGKGLIVKRQFEDRSHVIRVSTPCLLTALTELAEPRYMTVGGIVDAYNTTVRVIDYNELADTLAPEIIGLKGSPTNVIKSYTKQPKGTGEMLKDLSADEAVEAIVSRLEERNII